MTSYEIAANIFYSTVLVVSVILNTTACYIILFKVKKKELTHIFIISLSVTNLLESVIGLIPQIIISSEAKLEKTPLCITGSFAVFGFAVTSITHLSIFSLVRTVAIKYPIYYFKNSKRFWCRATLILICYCYGFSWAIFPVIGWSKYEIDLDKKRCSLDWRMTRPDSLSYILSILIFCNFLPGTLIAIGLYISKKVIYRRRTCKLRKNENNRSIDLLEKDYLRVCFLSSILFFAIWTPYAVVGILALSKIVPPPLLVTTAAMFSKISTISNVLTNCFINTSFRKHLLNLKIVRVFLNKKIESPRIEDV
ncbi:opsin-3 [Hydra vulgaris]|uniref:Opsin n=1 Tax=Hydra vulgaris TaxID=6087 RepID=A0A857GWT1_HYDVU|nr:opsin-3 [Hydra vulgaris]QHF16575.1 opsin [Hydra vulgaris]